MVEQGWFVLGLEVACSVGRNDNRTIIRIVVIEVETILTLRCGCQSQTHIAMKEMEAYPMYRGRHYCLSGILAIIFCVLPALAGPPVVVS